MRSSWFVGIGLLGLCIIGCSADTPAEVSPPKPAARSTVKAELIGPPQQDSPSPPKPVAGSEKHHRTTTTNVVGVVNSTKAPAVPVFETKVDGYGVSEEDATANAVETARDKVADFLASKYGEDYRPTAEELTAKQVVGAPEFETANVPVTTDAGKTIILKAVVPVKLTGDQVDTFRESARTHRVHDRMKIAGLVLAGCVSLLLVGGGYLRLEEATKGYYTTLLRVAAGGILIIIAGMLFGGFLGH